MVSKMQVDAKVVVTGKANNLLKGMTKMALREAVISGYGSVGETEIGYVATHAYDYAETIRSLAAPALANDAKHSAFAVFRDAIAEAAENPTEAFQTAKQVATGENYTNFYSDLVSGQKMIETDLLTASEGSVEAALDYSSVDWNDPAARDQYMKSIQDYAQATGLRDHAGFSADRPGASSDELKILLHTSSKEEYTAYIQTFERAIQENFQQELAGARDIARDLGYEGSFTDVKAMEKFAATLDGSNKGAMDNLIQMTNGSINKVDRYVLARISEGHIDIQQVLSTGEFNGVKLDPKALHAFAALNVYAHSDAVASAYQTRILEKIGGQTELSSVDLNNLGHVRTRCKEFEDALTKAGYGAWQIKNGTPDIASVANKHGKIKGIGLEHMSMKQLRAIDLSKIQDKDARAALRQYINLREHKDTLSAAKEMMGNMKMRLVQLSRKILGDSELSDAIGQIQSQYRNVQFAMKMWVKLGDFSKWIGKTSRKFHANFDKLLSKLANKFDGSKFSNLVSRYQDSRFGSKARNARHEERVAQGKEKAKARNAKKDAAKKAKTNKLAQTKRGQRRLARAAKKAEKKLLGKAGKQAGDLARRAGHLAAHGSVGTTGAGAAGGGTAAAAGGGGTAAAAGGGGGAAAGGAGGTATAVGGGGALVVCGWVLLIILIVAVCCQLIGAMCNVILSAATELDNSLLGKMASWIENFTWPWDATPEEKRNVMWYTMTKLQEQDAQSKQVGNVLGEGNVFCGGMYALDKEGGSIIKGGDADRGSVYWSQNKYSKDNMGTAETYYLYTNAETGEPINEYTNIKLCLSMAHAYTYQIESKKDIENFTNYAIGLWNYLNKSTVTATLTMCAGCLEYNYDCEVEWECPKDKCGDTPNCGHKNAGWNSSFYSRVWSYNADTYTSYGAKFNITPNMNDGYNAKMYIISSTYNHSKLNKTDKGCVQTKHNNTTGACEKIDSKGLGNGSKWTASLVNLSSISTVFAEHKTDSQYRQENRNFYGDSSGNYLKWYVDPKGVEACFKTTSMINGIGGVTAPTISSHDVTYHTGGTSSISGCNNQETLKTYYRSESTKYHGTKYYGASSINTWYDYDLGTGNRDVYLTTQRKCQTGTHGYAETYYKCNGHSTKVYCSAYSSTISYATSYSYNSTTKKYTTGNNGSKSHASWYPCSCGQNNYIWVYPSYYSSSSKPTKEKLYYCNGHTNHGTFDWYSDYYYDCQEWVPPVYDSKGNMTKAGYYKDGYSELGDYYICDGYKEVKYLESTTKFYACKGHLICHNTASDHYDCPGHNIKYCHGHIEYQIERKIVPTESDAIYKDNWTYTVTETYLWFIDVTTTFSPKKDAGDYKSMARKDWAGWNEDNRELMQTAYSADWYLKYGIGLGTFVGAQCSTIEKHELKVNFKIDSSTTTEARMEMLDFALDACGRVCYYPNGKATHAGYDPGNKFNTTTTAVFDDNNVRRAVRGLDPAYFADWVYRSTHNNATKSYLTSYYAGNGNSVTSSTKAGTPIVNNSGSKVRTGILVGYYTNGGTGYIKYIGIDPGSAETGGWVTIIDEPASGWKWTQGTCD